MKQGHVRQSKRVKISCSVILARAVQLVPQMCSILLRTSENFEFTCSWTSMMQVNVSVKDSVHLYICTSLSGLAIAAII